MPPAAEILCLGIRESTFLHNRRYANGIWMPALGDAHSPISALGRKRTYAVHKLISAGGTHKRFPSFSCVKRYTDLTVHRISGRIVRLD